eukprot:1146007-Pelagomonas_calceolata.AAC.3
MVRMMRERCAFDGSTAFDEGVSLYEGAVLKERAYLTTTPDPKLSISRQGRALSLTGLMLHCKGSARRFGIK